MTRIALAIWVGLLCVAFAIDRVGEALSNITVNSTTRVRIEKGGVHE